MNISVIISTYSKDKFNEVRDCILSLRKQSVEPLEIIVVLDPSQDLIDFYKSHLPLDVKIAVSRDFGLSAARNAGVKISQGDILAFIDDDAKADNDWLKHMLTNYSDISVIGVGGVVKPLWASERPFWFPEELDWIIGCSYKGLPAKKAIVRNPIGCNMSFRRFVFEKIGHFCSDVGRHGKKLLLDGEEAEFCLRASNSLPSSKVVYDPLAIVYHKVEARRLTIKYVTKRAFYQGISKARIANYELGSKALSPEREYFKSILLKAIPSRIKHVYRPKNLSQLAVLGFSSLFVLTGYFLGKVTKRSKPKEFV